ncbi:hypothetical protein LWI28_024906 [Acer negundo]|uniref:Cathepsin propeptide inhibitor domain-containing protein n=1 Tax=Acer negundo TaxID=4023 RepID=A0AAD5J1L5_ACENE|nr:hypothetical protein LWI28_024906 [Acer negundo]
MSRTLQDVSLMYERHEQWIARYGRVYSDNDEKEKRFQIYKENVALIESFNKANNKPYKLGVNEFADLTNEEFKASRNRFKGHMCSQNELISFKYENVTAVPSTMDWRKKGAVTPIKDQGQCGGFLLGFILLGMSGGLCNCRFAFFSTASLQSHEAPCQNKTDSVLKVELLKIEV